MDGQEGSEGRKGHDAPGGDAVLVVAVRAGGVKRFGELLVRHEERVRAVIVRRLRRSGGAADTDAVAEAVQHTFFLAFRHLAALADPVRFAAWLVRIAERVAAEAVRQGARRQGTRTVRLASNSNRASRTGNWCCSTAKSRPTSRRRSPTMRRPPSCWSRGTRPSTSARISSRQNGSTGAQSTMRTPARRNATTRSSTGSLRRRGRSFGRRRSTRATRSWRRGQIIRRVPGSTTSAATTSNGSAATRRRARATAPRSMRRGATICRGWRRPRSIGWLARRRRTRKDGRMRRSSRGCRPSRNPAAC
ncbi:MAG: hypothetical protein EXS13_10830 [Planctomycetes bacterium]|nr:hypothetical protein [Planctomycetota bacterium]